MKVIAVIATVIIIKSKKRLIMTILIMIDSEDKDNDNNVLKIRAMMIIKLILTVKIMIWKSNLIIAF